MMASSNGDEEEEIEDGDSDDDWVIQNPSGPTITVPGSSKAAKERSQR